MATHYGPLIWLFLLKSYILNINQTIQPTCNVLTNWWTELHFNQREQNINDKIIVILNRGFSSALKGRIHCEIFLSRHFMKYSFRVISWNTFTLYPTFRSSRSDVFCKKGVLGNFTKFTGKHLYQSLF